MGEVRKVRWCCTTKVRHPNWNGVCCISSDLRPLTPYPNLRRNKTMGVILFILFGLVVGLIARAIMPGAQPLGFILTAILGMAGSFVGSFIGNMIRGGGNMEVNDPYNWIGAILGSLLLLFLYGMFAGRRTNV